MFLFFITKGGDAVNLSIDDPVYDSWWVRKMWYDV